MLRATMRPWKLMAALTLAVALLVSACAESDESAQTTDSNPSTDTTAGSESTVDDGEEEEPQSDYDREASITIVWEKPLAGGMDPLGSNGPASQFVRNPVYDTLIGLGSNGELVPSLATEWTFDGPEVLELSLRSGVSFHDGTPFDADAVVANFERQRTSEEATGTITALLSQIDSVEVVDSETVRYILSEPNWHFPYTLATDVGMMISPQLLESEENLSAVAAGTGLYKLVDFDPDAGANYVRNDEYWDAVRLASAPQDLHLRLVPDAQARLNGAISGDFEISYVDPNQIQQAQDAGLNYQLRQTLLHYSIWFNYNRFPAFQDLRVRQAFMYGIDRDEITEGLTLGTGAATPQMFPPDYFAFDPELGADQYPYDPERSRQLLAEAGFPDGIDISVKLNPVTFDQELGQAVQAQLAEAGIRVELGTDPNFSAWAVDGDWDAILVSISGRANPLDTLLSEVATEGVMNPGRFAPPPELQEIIDQIKATPLDDPELQALIQSGSRMAAENALNIPILIPAFNFVTHPCVVDFVPPIFGAPMLGSAAWEGGCER